MQRFYAIDYYFGNATAVVHGSVSILKCTYSGMMGDISILIEKTKDKGRIVTLSWVAIHKMCMSCHVKSRILFNGCRYKLDIISFSVITSDFVFKAI